MTQILERPVTTEITPSAIIGTPRGGSYVTLPGHPGGAHRTAPGCVSLPGGGTRAGNKDQGSYVTLHSTRLGRDRNQLTRRG